MFNSVVERGLDFVTKGRGQGGNQTRTWPIFIDIVGVPVRFDRGAFFISLAFILHISLLLCCFVVSFLFHPSVGLISAIEDYGRSDLKGADMHICPSFDAPDALTRYL